MLEKISSEFLKHYISKVIAVDFVYLREFAYTYHAYTHFVIFDKVSFKILKEAVLISKACKRVDVSLYAVISDRAAEEFGDLVLIPYNDSAAGTQVVFAV